MKPNQTKDEAAKWEERYRSGDLSQRAVDPFLEEAWQNYLVPAPDGPLQVLDVAGGSGRHAIWMAQQGCRVRLVDRSSHAIQLAKDRAKEAKVRLDTELRDVMNDGLGDSRYDLVLVFYFLDRNLFPALQNALKPGGWIFYKTYLQGHKAKHCTFNPDYLLAPGELRSAFPGLKVIHYREQDGPQPVAELVAQKNE